VNPVPVALTAGVAKSKEPLLVTKTEPVPVLLTAIAPIGRLDALTEIELLGKALVGTVKLPVYRAVPLVIRISSRLPVNLDAKELSAPTTI
jgi:hypothetical protein